MAPKNRNQTKGKNKPSIQKKPDRLTREQARLETALKGQEQTRIQDVSQRDSNTHNLRSRQVRKPMPPPLPVHTTSLSPSRLRTKSPVRPPDKSKPPGRIRPLSQALLDKVDQLMQE